MLILIIILVLVFGLAGGFTDFRPLEADEGQNKGKMGDLTDDEIDVAAGERDQLAGKIQQKYGVGREEAERQVDEWAKDLKER